MFSFWMILLVAQEIFAIHDRSPAQRHGGKGPTAGTVNLLVICVSDL